MTLDYRQERLLRRADHALCESDPDLASMLSIFARLTTAEEMPVWEQLRRWRSWDWRILLWPVAAIAFLVAFAVVFAAGGGSKAATACGRACRRRVGGYGNGSKGAGRAALDPASRPGLGPMRG